MSFKNVIAQEIAKRAGIDVAECESYIEIPPQKEMGDFAFPCFKLAKVMRKAPTAIAQELLENIDIPDFVKNAEVKGGYLNFFIDPTKRAEDVLKEILEKGEKYWASDEGQGKNICMD